MFSLVILLAIGIISCEESTIDNKSGGGTFTLKDIPAEFNGMYACLEGDFSWYRGGDYDTSSHILKSVLISNGRVSMSMYDMPFYKPYLGNATMQAYIYIYKEPTQSIANVSPHIVSIYFRNKQFTNGSATASWNDAYSIDYNKWL